MLDRPTDSNELPRPEIQESASPAELIAEDAPRGAVNDLYQRAADELSAYIRRIFGDGPPDPEEVTQEAFTRLYEQPDLSRIKSLRAFLWRTARNLVLTHKRQVATRSKYDFEIEQLFFAVDEPALSPENIFRVREQLKLVNDTLKKMPERRRKAFLWHRVDGQNFTTIAGRLGINRRSVSKHIAKAAFDIETALNETRSGSGS